MRISMITIKLAILSLLICISRWSEALEWDCNRPWPDLELFLPVSVNPGPRQMEWRNIFLRTFLLFWPIEISKTKLLIVIDEEARNSAGTELLNSTLSNIDRLKGLYRLTFDDIDRMYYAGIGSLRQQYIMFYPDNYTTSEYVGYIDTDAFLLTYIDREDLFENGKPVVNGKSGNPHKKYNKDPLWHTITHTTYDVLGVTEPMKCMAYFPMIVKVSHMIALRKYLETKYNLPFYDVFRFHILSKTFSQFNIFCAYLFHFHHDDYTWYVHDLSPEWDFSNPVIGQEANASSYTPQMRIPKPRVATHARYHSPVPLDGGYAFSTIDVLQSGICFSPPFPKPLSYSPCKFYTRDEDFHTEIFEEMHRFEWSDFTTIQHPSSLQHQAYQRYERIKHCNHSFDDTLTYENITKIMSMKLGLHDGDMIYTHETGKRLFVYQNNTLRGFPNYDTFVKMGYQNKKGTMLSHRQFKNIEKGPDLPAI